MRMRYRAGLWVLLGVIGSGARCPGGDGAAKVVFPGGEWESREPAALGLDGAKLDRIAEVLAGRGCIVKDGYVVKTWGSQSKKGDWASSAKPVLSTLLLFAIKEGKVASVEAKIADFGWKLKEKDRSMTLAHLANMMSGYARPEPPGKAWAYNDFAIQLYQKTLFDKIYKADPDKTAAERFAAIGLQDGLTFDSNRRRLSASVRDFARIGWFWLNKGTWNGKEVLPSRFFDEYRKPHVPPDLPLSQGEGDDDYLKIGTYGGGSNHFSKAGPGVYGFNWWFNAPLGGKPDRTTWPDAPKDTFMSLGAHGNCSAMIPSLGLVLVGASANWGESEPGNREAPTNRVLAMLAESVRKPSAAADTRAGGRAGERAREDRVTHGEKSATAAWVSGELKKWHGVTLTFEGPKASETGEPNPFRDYRMTVVFARFLRTVEVPGYFAADGNAAESGAAEGDKWRVDFLPDEEGPWAYHVSFVRGKDVAMKLDANAGERCGPDGACGSLEIAATDKRPPDVRGMGVLRDVGRRYFEFAHTGEVFLKAGADSPENFLAYADFDDTKATHKYEPHVKDWKEGDPTWRGGRGKGIIGAVNYLASKGVNSIYFLPMNVKGDGKDVWPWVSDKTRDRYDVSKLAQWEIVFSHMDRMGIAMHVVQQEQENDQLLDNGELGPERKLYYRELAARFAHHPAVIWNLGEENTNTTEEQKSFAKYIRAVAPWDHPIVIHTFPSEYEKVYGPLLGDKNISGASLQVSKVERIPKVVSEWVKRSAASGRTWAVFLDELGPPGVGVLADSDDAGHDEIRKTALWGTLMSGGAGVEWFFGVDHPNGDLDCEDFRSRDRMWDQTRHAVEFFRKYVDIRRLAPTGDVVTAGKAKCLAGAGEVYVVYLENGGEVELELPAGEYVVQWYDPRSGGELVAGSVETMSGGGKRSLGPPPGHVSKDWVALVKRAGIGDR